MLIEKTKINQRHKNEELVIANFHSLNDVDFDMMNDLNLLTNRISNMHLATNSPNSSNGNEIKLLKPIALRPTVNQFDSQLNVSKKNLQLKSSSSCLKNEQTPNRPHLNFVKMIIQTFIENKLVQGNPNREMDLMSFILYFSKMSKLNNSTESSCSSFLYKNFIELDLEKIEQDLN